MLRKSDQNYDNADYRCWFCLCIPTGMSLHICLLQRQKSVSFGAVIFLFLADLLLCGRCRYLFFNMRDKYYCTRLSPKKTPFFYSFGTYIMQVFIPIISIQL